MEKKEERNKEVILYPPTYSFLFSSLPKLKKEKLERENPGCTEKQGYNLR